MGKAQGAQWSNRVQSNYNPEDRRRSMMPRPQLEHCCSLIWDRQLLFSFIDTRSSRVAAQQLLGAQSPPPCKGTVITPSVGWPFRTTKICQIQPHCGGKVTQWQWRGGSIAQCMTLWCLLLGGPEYRIWKLQFAISNLYDF